MSVQVEVHPPIHLLYDDLHLTIVPAPPGIEEVLKYTEKVMTEISDPKRPWVKRETRKHVVRMYEILDRNPRVIQTYAGLIDRIMAWCIEHGYIITALHDTRQKFPKPRLDLMGGFRCKQRELLTDFLLKERNGMLLAPTRYGKFTLITNTIRAFPGVTTVVTLPGIDLIDQTHNDLKEALPRREVKKIGGPKSSKYPSDDVTVCSIDSLHKCDPGKVRLMLIDEPHAAVTTGRAPEIVKFNMARRLAFGATLTGRFDGRDDLLQAIVGPPLVERTYKEAVAEGAICPLVVYMMKIKFDAFRCLRRESAYDKLLLKSDRMAEVCAKLSKEIIPPDWQTLIFIKDEKQAEGYWDKIKDEGVIAMAKRMNNTERAEMFRLMQENIVKRCLATRIYSQGVTFHDIRCLINAEGGGGSIGSIQKPGRLAEIRPDKRCGVVFDFIFDCEQDPVLDPDQPPVFRNGEAWRAVIHDSWSRYKVYRDKGYEVHIIEGWNALEKAFKERAL
jgi:superfamily II DNA or RNA helicase